MSLVIKPTELCNFSCDFCSSTHLVDDKKARLDLERIYAFLDRFPRTETIFVVGGDPLMMPPSYYRSLVDFIERRNLPTVVSMTTNLWAFYKNPNYWKEILRHPRVEVGTSFQYGGGRKISQDRVLTEEIFMDVYRTFREHVPNKDLCFLAVIDDANEGLALEHVLLAKRLGTQCRLVWTNASGKSTRPFPMAKLYRIMVQIWRMGLAQYEQTSLGISEKLRGLEISCPVSRNCDGSMRSLNPDGRYFSCGPLNDDLDPKNEIDFDSEVRRGEAFYLPIQTQSHARHLKDECFSCSMFQVCNACHKHVGDLKRTGLVEEQCQTMKAIAGDLHEMAGATEIKEMIRDIDRSNLARREALNVR